MEKIRNSKQYNIEECTQRFAKDIRAFVKKLPKTVGNIEDGKQQTLIQEPTELMMIFSSIMRKSS